ncbi:hypothetical protein PAEPH01_0746 [Pancytospora epiphaga]|nr:hypothetical protein PAEPH01_0746 [Pancytospora epiphaga]
MGLKRKRNLKVDLITKYNVFILSELHSEYLEDYIEARDTGMEADEEKEIQLQKIIQENGGNIPLPVIAQVENPVRKFYGPVSTKERIRWSNDVPNECIEDQGEIRKIDELFSLSGQACVGTAPEIEGGERVDSTEPENMAVYQEQGINIKKVASADSTPQSTGQSLNDITIEEEDIDGLIAVNNASENIRNAFLLFGDSSTAISNRNERLIEYILHKVIIRYERVGYEAYTCFRRRIFHPTFKSRRNEAIMLEKLERMSAEFYALEDLCSMLLEKTELESKYLRQTNRLVKAYHDVDMPKKFKRKYRKRILGIVEASAPSRLSLNVHATMTNRDKIAYLRNIKPGTDLPLDVNYHSKIGPFLEEGEWKGEKKAVSADIAPPRKKVCRRCENKWGRIFFTDDRQHNI